MSQPALEIKGLHKRFGGIVATSGVSLKVKKGSLHALIGPNGAGKTTLITQLSGELAPDSGQILHHGSDVTQLDVVKRCKSGIARSFQITSLFKEYTALENILLSTLSRRGECKRFWRPALSHSAALKRAEEILVQIGLRDYRDVQAGVLSHGEHRQLEVGMALATDADVLLLDEPLAGIGSADAAAMIGLLQQLKGGPSIILVEHDMDAVFALADEISVLVYGSIIATGTPEEIRKSIEVRTAYLGEELL
jgi:branched-chain amino acid transport system ATP-binding protein